MLKDSLNIITIKPGKIKKSQIDTISINQLAVNCIIGVYPKERRQPQPLLISVDIGTDFTVAAQEDDISKTINYDEVSSHITQIAEQGKFKLIETLAEHIAHYILTLPNTYKVTINLEKTNALTYATSASVTLERYQDTQHAGST